jgi:hypothetical protein
MIHFPRSKFGRVIEMTLAQLSAHGVTGGGQPLMQVLENGEARAKLHDGTANKPVIGFSVMKAGLETALSFAQTVTPDSTTTTYSLKYAPTGTPTAFNETTNTAIVVGASAAAGQVGLVGQVLTTHSSMVGQKIVIVYNFSPTVAQLALLQGHVDAGGPVQLSIGSISVMKSGILYTSQFESNELWFNFDDTTSALVVNASSKVGVGTGTEPKVPSGQILHAPNGDVPFVGFSFAC